MTDYYEPLVYVVPADEEGMLLKSILQQKLQISRKLLSRIKLTDQGISVNGVRQFINLKVNAGDVIEVRMEQEQSDDILPQELPLHILYEDDHLLIVDKAAGVVVHPTHGHYTNTLANAVVYYWQQREQKYRFRPVHRLDQDTSGVLAIAKNPYVHQQISAQLIAGHVEKEYVAIVHGRPEVEEGTISAPIDRDPVEPHRRIVTESGYKAITHYSVEQHFESATRVRVRLETGRTHQIRVHMRYIGCPLIGDRLYGTSEDQHADSFVSRHALHAAMLSFAHPISKERMKFVAELPDDLIMLEQRIGDSI